MTATLEHRGPDGSGAWSAATSIGTVALGHRRLAIIDPTGGAQPMRDASTGVVLSYNGEIYNYLDLRETLVALGRRFESVGDTEVVLRAFLEWGVEAFGRFRGMFGLAIWDPRSQQVILARDPFGKKPVFLMQTAGAFLFASEPKAILAYDPCLKALDEESVGEFLAWRYVPAPHTLFRGLKKLMPGSWASWDGAELRETVYFEPPYASDAGRRDIDDPVGAFAEVFEEAVRLRLQSDAPYGAFLSGGLDSSAVVAMMARHSSGPLRTYSVGVEAARDSELPFARLVADRFATRHEELSLSVQDMVDSLPALTAFSDAPVSEPTNIPMWLLARAASTDVKVILTGEGSDELLGGYPKHLAEQHGGALRALVGPLLDERVLGPLLRRSPVRRPRLQTLSASIGLRDPQDRLPRWMGALGRREREALLNRSVPPARPPGGPLFKAGARRSAVERALLFDQASWLPDNLLERADRMSMAASVEARMPFMDTELAALMAALPDEWRLRHGVGKQILRRAMEGTLPRTIIHRRKNGFRLPVEHWLQGPMAEFTRDALQSAHSRSRALYRAPALDRVLEEHFGGRRPRTKLIWSMLALEWFLRTFALSWPT